MTATDVPRDTAEAMFEELAQAVDDAAAAVRSLDADARVRAQALQAAIEAFHRPALVHIVRTLREDPRGKELLFALVDDPGVRAVLALHGIIRADPATRARQALVAVRPYLQSHGGDVELVRVEGGTAFVRLQGSCSGCSMSAVTLRNGVEEALAAVDGIERLEVLDDQPSAAFIPLDQIGRVSGSGESGENDLRAAGWVAGPTTTDVPAGGMARFDVEVAPPADGEPAQVDSFVVTHIDQRIAVFRNACVHQGRTLDGGMIDDGVLTCPWHGFTFDATTGECLSAPGAQLAQVPARVDDGRVWIRAHGG